MLQLLTLLSALFLASSVQAETFDHGSWATLLGQYVVEIDDGKATQHDYGGFLAQRTDLKQ